MEHRDRPLAIGALMLLLLCSCGTAKHGMADGRYRLGGEAVHVEVIADTIVIGTGGVPGHGADAIRLPPTLPQDRVPGPLRLAQNSFDIDLLSIPVKYRPAAADLQPQLETQLSAALYLGRRTDLYRLRYPASAYGVAEREERHWGLSGGLLGGLGGAGINATTTAGQVGQEYTGVVGSYGPALIGALDRATLGFAVGRDHLLNSHARAWSFEAQPWLGFVFGINLN
jgi:hypothetical protein